MLNVAGSHESHLIRLDIFPLLEQLVEQLRELSTVVTESGTAHFLKAKPPGTEEWEVSSNPLHDISVALGDIWYADDYQMHETVAYAGVVSLPQSALKLLQGINEMKAAVAAKFQCIPDKLVQDSDGIRHTLERYVLKRTSFERLSKKQAFRQVVVVKRSQVSRLRFSCTPLRKVEKKSRDLVVGMVKRSTASELTKQLDLQRIADVGDHEFAYDRPAPMRPRVEVHLREAGKPRSLPAVVPICVIDDCCEELVIEGFDEGKRATRDRPRSKVSNQRFLDSLPLYRYLRFI